MNTQKNTENKNKYKITVEKQEGSQIKILGEIPFEHIERFRSQAVKNISQDMALDGFRKGHIPEQVLVKHVGEMAILEEEAQLALEKAYPEIIETEKIKALGRPSVKITKLAPNNPMTFEATTAVIPEITLGDYMQIAKEVMNSKEAIALEDNEITEGIDHIRRQWVKAEKFSVLKKENPNESIDPSTIEVKDEELPELTDEFVAQVGPFENVLQFKERFTANLIKEKELRQQEKKRIEMMEKVIESTKLDIPEILVESELDKMSAQFEADVARAGIQIDQYLQAINKKRDDLREEWRPDAVKQAKMQFILNEIATKENIQPEEERIQKEMDLLMKQYKEADPLRARIYIETILTNQKVFEFLENLKG
jgi:trigger factor